MRMQNAGFAREFVRKTAFTPPEGRDERLAVEWERPRPKLGQIARPLVLIVPWNEVIEREGEETGDVVWTPPPPEGTAIHFDLVYASAGMKVTGHPGARSMGTQLVGKVELEKGEQVFVTSLVRVMRRELRATVDRLRSAPILDEGQPIDKVGMLAFGAEPDPDADDGTQVGTVIDVTRPDEDNSQ
jgi:hypothetical protein